MDLNNPTSRLNNMNIFTFIKEIYLSLKNLTNGTNQNKDLINSQFTKLNKQISKLESQHTELNDKLDTIINLFNNQFNSSTEIETDIQSKLQNILNDDLKSIHNIDTNKLNLKPNELTLSNLEENDYSLQDIQNSVDANINNVLNLNQEDLLLDNNLSSFEEYLSEELTHTEMNGDYNNDNDNENGEENKKKSKSAIDLVF